MTFMDVLNSMIEDEAETFDKDVKSDFRDSYEYYAQGVTARFTLDSDEIVIRLYDVQSLACFYRVVVPVDAIMLKKQFADYIYNELNGSSVVAVIVDQANCTEAKNGARIALERILEHTYNIKLFSTDSVRREAANVDSFDIADKVHDICIDVAKTEKNILLDHIKPYLVKLDRRAVNVVLAYTETTLLELTGVERLREVIRLLASYVDICNNEILFIHDQVIRTNNVSLLSGDIDLSSAIALAYQGVYTFDEVKENINKMESKMR